MTERMSDTQEYMADLTQIDEETRSQLRERKAVLNALDKIKKEYDAAQKKHPAWPDNASNCSLSGIKENLLAFRQSNDTDKASAATIILEELYEALEAILEGDIEQAKVELAQTGAMILRLYMNVERYRSK